MSKPSSYDQFYVRNDNQCLFAYVHGSVYRVKRDPLLKQTYISITFNGRLIYFYDYVADSVLVEEPIGMAIYQSHIRGIESVQKSRDFDDRCRVDVSYLWLLLERKDLLDADYSNEPLYIKGQHMIDIVEKTEGYSEMYTSPLQQAISIKIDQDRLYFIPPFLIEDNLVDLSPDTGLSRIVEYEFEQR